MKKPFGILLALAAFALAIVSGCNNDAASPVTTSSKGETPDFVKLPERLEKTLAKRVTVTKFITRAQGGELRLHTSYRAAPDSHRVEIDIKLKIKPLDLPYDDSLSMSLDDVLFLTQVNMTFGPHGIIFTEPIRLDVEAEGLDLPGVRRKLKLYYVSSTGWLEMPNSKATYREGELDAEGRLPHFSQYAFGRVD